LREVGVIACEDTRVTRKLLAHYDIHTRLVSCHAHSAPEEVAEIARRLAEGEDVAYATDAGTPLVSDPGDMLIAAAIACGAKVVPIPGASALLAALAASGLPTGRFVFLGFLPRDDADRREIIAPLRNSPFTIVLFESPHRAGEALEALERGLGDRQAAVARELTKKFEEILRGRLSALRAAIGEELRGEVAIVVGPAEAEPETPRIDDARAQVRALLESGLKPVDAARTIAGAFGLGRKEAYQLVLDVKNETAPKPV
jgi:16S rRNA (cytidine1402-2'-O)-methyltransferase